MEWLSNSIRVSGQREPIMIAEKDHRLLSGARRLEACKRANILFVDAVFPSNIVEGAQELRRHLSNPDPRYSLPMNVIERVGAAFLLHRLPPPTGADGRFNRDTHTSAAVDLPVKVYRVLRSTIRKAERNSEISPRDSQQKAQRTLSLMVQAVESPPPQYPLNSLLSMLHQLLLQGICPDALESCFPYLDENTTQHDQSDAFPAQTKGASPRKYIDYVRAADVLKGTLDGMSYVITEDLAGSEHYDYILKTLREVRRMSHTYAKRMEKMRSAQ